MIKAPCKSVSWSCEVLPAICLLLNCHQPPLTQQPDSLLVDGGPRSIIIHRKLRAGKDRQLMNMSQANKQGPLCGLGASLSPQPHPFTGHHQFSHSGDGSTEKTKETVLSDKEAAVHTLLPLPPAFVGNIKLLQVLTGLNSKAKNLIQTL